MESFWEKTLGYHVVTAFLRKKKLIFGTILKLLVLVVLSFVCVGTLLSTVAYVISICIHSMFLLFINLYTEKVYVSFYFSFFIGGMGI